MRIVAGSAGGRHIDAPSGSVTRPTSDRVREAMFSMLGSMDAVQGQYVVDLFAGSGALGLEALSRGASAATFVDNDRLAAGVVKSNLTVLGLGPGEVVVQDATSWLAGAAPMDLVLVDPPYAFSGWAILLELLRSRTGLAVLETGESLVLGPEWEVLRQKRYGGTVVTIVGPSPSRGPALGVL